MTENQNLDLLGFMDKKKIQYAQSRNELAWNLAIAQKIFFAKI